VTKRVDLELYLPPPSVAVKSSYRYSSTLPPTPFLKRHTEKFNNKKQKCGGKFPLLSNIQSLHTTLAVEIVSLNNRRKQIMFRADEIVFSR
jgi:hypothetical protein